MTSGTQCRPYYANVSDRRKGSALPHSAFTAVARALRLYPLDMRLLPHVTSPHAPSASSEQAGARSGAGKAQAQSKHTVAAGADSLPQSAGGGACGAMRHGCHCREMQAALRY
jgi:hypothetical protein